MNLGLLILKGRRQQKDDVNRNFRFVVVDLDKGNSYPQNFVCVLPRNFRLFNVAKLEAIFGSNGRELAERLLNEAKMRERDSETLQEIERRLKVLRPSGTSDSARL